ncbi:MAG: hypothetical protein WCS94_07240 [Verrucomicrobiota bacterium]
MKPKNVIQRIFFNIAIALLLLLGPAAWAQFTFTTNDAITITGYTGSDGIVTIPSATNGYSWRQNSNKSLGRFITTDTPNKLKRI